MTSPQARLDAATRHEAAILLTRCCGASRWVKRMLERRPFGSESALHAAADEAWAGLSREDYLEAFAHHPRLGDDPARASTVAARFAAADWAADEQSRVGQADDATLDALRDENRDYEQRFGFVFLLCATGKGADEVLAVLRARIGNEADEELRVAAAEQAKITHLRLEKLAP